jgi:hypothetical protein
MPLVQHGPPEWVWERHPDPLKWDVIALPAIGDERPNYELRLACGLQILRVHVFNEQEMWALAATIEEALPKPTA